MAWHALLVTRRSAREAYTRLLGVELVPTRDARVVLLGSCQTLKRHGLLGFAVQ